ncbi:uncharacterized protein LOC124372588, partial [Homalodisca vitripennis]|uniref:uncharacterized protein LOC124372588 n=1 Tax=Homalodisca vitripennis TaxID=197043 RepID=UPI001EE9BBBA
MTYSVSNLSVCTVYSGSVVVKLSETRSSTRKATFSQLTITNGSIIAKKELDYSHRNYTVVDLKPCQSYSFELKLVDENGTSTVDYKAVNVITEASDLMSVSNLELDRVSLYSLYLKWFLPEESSCVCVKLH